MLSFEAETSLFSSNCKSFTGPLCCSVRMSKPERVSHNLMLPSALPLAILTSLNSTLVLWGGDKKGKREVSEREEGEGKRREERERERRGESERERERERYLLMTLVCPTRVCSGLSLSTFQT